MRVWQVDRIKTIPSDCWCGQVCACAFLCVCVCLVLGVQKAIWQWRLTLGTVPVCRIRTGRSWIQITAHTQYHFKLTHTYTHTAAAAAALHRCFEKTH